MFLHTRTARKELSLRPAGVAGVAAAVSRQLCELCELLRSLGGRSGELWRDERGGGGGCGVL